MNRATLDILQIISMVAVPAIGGMIAWFHRSNIAHWRQIFRQIRKAKRVARKAQRAHIHFDGRLAVIERLLRPQHPEE